MVLVIVPAGVGKQLRIVQTEIMVLLLIRVSTLCASMYATHFISNEATVGQSPLMIGYNL